MMLLSSGGYLAIAIAVLVGLGALAVVLFLLLRHGPKVERKKCALCQDYSCPIAMSLNHKEDGEE